MFFAAGRYNIRCNMQFSDEGYIINLLRHGENSLIVTVLSSLHGKVAGYVSGALSKKKIRNISAWQCHIF